MVKCDLWGNVTYYENLINDKNEWVKQTFIGEDLVIYEDSNGNYFNCEWGECTFPYLIIKNSDGNYGDITYPDYHTVDYSSISTNSGYNYGYKEWVVTTPIIEGNKSVIYLGPAPYITLSGTYSTPPEYSASSRGYTLSIDAYNNVSCSGSTSSSYYSTIGGGFSSTIETTTDSTFTISDGTYSFISGGCNNRIYNYDEMVKKISHYYGSNFYYYGD